MYERFWKELHTTDLTFWRDWDAYRLAPGAPRPPIAVSNLLIRMASHVSHFVTRLFAIDAPMAAIARSTRAQDDLFRFKVDFVRRRALPFTKAVVPVASSQEDDAIVRRLTAQASTEDRELAVARAGCALMDREKAGEQSQSVRRDVEALKRWCASRVNDPAYREWVIFRFPRTLDYWNLVETCKSSVAGEAGEGLGGLITGPRWRRRRRDGFTLTDARMKPRDVLSEIQYCVLCHDRNKDSCSKGLCDKNGTVAVNPLGIDLRGCPLDEKISEMHTLRKRGDAIGALALAMLDNPMCPGTGHRICNDCMKSCIYQKQEPVDIPQTETGILTEVLNLPWGVEIYGLLTRWNPLNVRRPYALPYNGKNVLVVGLGPAGYTLAHYLLNEGFGVVAIDGLKIEPLPDEIAGSAVAPPRPIHTWSEIYRELDERVLEGFGGVSEYGITVRWDKNFLTLLHLTLARRRGLRMYGGVRFGGALSIEDAWGYGFDHVAIAAGAGRPAIIDMKNNLIRGIRKASDFLMALQLTGAFKREALANLQMRLPAIVIGGGLTAIDAATEALAYYPAQVEKTLTRYEELVAELGEARVRAVYSVEELALLDEYLTHGRAVGAERERAMLTGERPDFVPLVRSWGGVTIAYRRRLVDSPAYRLNHEEIARAFEEGIAFAENLIPVEAVSDEYGALRALVFKRDGQDTPVTLAARTALIAAGTTPNITCEKEAPGTFQLDPNGKFFKPHAVSLGVDGRFHLAPDPNGFFTSYETGGRFVTFYGDNHPRYAGNVVRAMAAAKDGFRHVTQLFAREIGALDPAQQPLRDASWLRLVERLDGDLLAYVEDLVRLTPSIVELVVKAPAAARHFHPGQFYRLQNFESIARRVGANNHRVPLLMEGVALTGASVDKARGLVSLIALELGVSSRLIARLKKGEPVVVMGPTGAPTEIPDHQRVLLLGGGLGNAVLFSIAKAMKDRGNIVIYFAGYKNGEDVFKREEIEGATDQVIWSTDTGSAIEPHRPQDRHFRGNIVQALLAYQSGELGRCLVPLESVDRLMAIGSDRMMAAVQAVRHGPLAAHLRPDHVAVASINSPMQCMMKEVCAQCLQRHVDPETGKDVFVFSCFNQDQPMDRVDFANLAARLGQNAVQERLGNMWLDHLMNAESTHVDRRTSPPTSR